MQRKNLARGRLGKVWRGVKGFRLDHIRKANPRPNERASDLSPIGWVLLGRLHKVQ